MIKIENVVVMNFLGAIRGMRNALESWEKSDSKYILNTDEVPSEDIYNCVCTYTGVDCDNDELKKVWRWLVKNAKIPSEIESSEYFLMGKNDLELAKKLVLAGASHRKFLRQIFVSCDITASLYWLKEHDTYKVGTVRNSTSTMHTLTKEPITMKNFSFLDDGWQEEAFEQYVQLLESIRQTFVATGDKTVWCKLVQMLPSAWNQKSTMTYNYEVLRAMYHDRKNHKLEEWRSFCAWIETLPYAKELILARR